ncbi:hypothetical protein BU14_0077s0001 [Porphyra umbilicalis]|uniref:F-box domain-containing protein n=1 Tax=Porphyra umbilicalis TaxID=2786 RepID=A0A1X6PEX2_PORUM|nr:hypothetical protein BU14_0077s0001 [Porphyra umbilicalis]|eukprot:OSX79381.1 hypothetical protein BU14_0077s0001 [Porphyra umbilicalis]
MSSPRRLLYDGGGASPSTSPPLDLSDLGDDCLWLVAAAAWRTGTPLGLLGACRRSRQAAMDTLEALQLSWCSACCPRIDGTVLGAAAGVAVAAAGGLGRAHPPNLEARLGTVLQLLRSRPRRLQSLTLADNPDGSFRRSTLEDAPAVPAPCWSDASTRIVVWRMIGAALRGARRLTTLSATNTAISAVVALLTPPTSVEGAPAVAAPGHGLAPMEAYVSGDVAAARPPPPHVPLNVLILRVGREQDRNCRDAHHELAAALVLAAPIVVDLSVLWTFSGLPDPLATAFGGAGVMVNLRKLTIKIPDGLLCPRTAQSVAAVCPHVTEIDVGAAFWRDVGISWSLERNAFEQLRRLTVNSTQQVYIFDDLRPLLADRALDDFWLTIADPHGGETVSLMARGVVDAVLGSAKLPPSLAMENVLIPEADWLRLVAEPRLGESVSTLALSPRASPAAVLAAFAPAPHLTKLWVQLDLGLLVGKVDVALEPSPWAGLTALAELTIQVEWLADYARRDDGAIAAAWSVPAVSWAVASIEESPCRDTLTRLVIIGRGEVVADAAEIDVFKPAAQWPALRRLDVTIERAGWDRHPDSSGAETPRRPPRGVAYRPTAERAAELRRRLQQALPQVSATLTYKED